MYSATKYVNGVILCIQQKVRNFCAQNVGTFVHAPSHVFGYVYALRECICD
jgi:hypothetical protein